MGQGRVDTGVDPRLIPGHDLGSTRPKGMKDRSQLQGGVRPLGPEFNQTIRVKGLGKVVPIPEPHAGMPRKSLIKGIEHTLGPTPPGKPVVEKEWRRGAPVSPHHGRRPGGAHRAPSRAPPARPEAPLQRPRLEKAGRNDPMDPLRGPRRIGRPHDPAPLPKHGRKAA
jgi:hypothetical protein